MSRRADDDVVPPETKPLLGHLADLRKALLGSLAALAIGMAVVAPFAPAVFGALKRPLVLATGNADPFLRTIDVVGGFSLAMKVVFWGGLVLAAPAIVGFAAGFVFPGLTPRERRAVRGAGGFAAVLFAGGVAMGYFLTLPVALEVMIGLNAWMGVRPEWTVTSYVSFALQLLLAFGLVFELPILLLVLGRLGVVTSAQLREKRRHAIVILFVVAMLLTPPDVFTQLVMAVPLVVLYEACIWLIRAMERARPDTIA